MRSPTPCDYRGLCHCFIGHRTLRRVVGRSTSKLQIWPAGSYTDVTALSSALIYTLGCPEVVLSYRSLLSVQKTLHKFGKLALHHIASLLLHLCPIDPGAQLRLRALHTYYYKPRLIITDVRHRCFPEHARAGQSQHRIVPASWISCRVQAAAHLHSKAPHATAISIMRCSGERAPMQHQRNMRQSKRDRN